MPLNVSSTMRSSSGGQKLYYTASGIITLKQVRLYNTILISWWWAHGARNMYRHDINLL